MSEFQFSTCLREILIDRVRVRVDQKGSALLKEKFKDGGEMRLHLHGVPSDSLIFKPEKFGQLSGLQDGEWRKSCDYIVASTWQGKDVVAFIELKKTLRDGKGPEQLRWSQPLIRYLRSICLLRSWPSSSPSEFNEVFWMFGERDQRRLDKQPTRTKREVRVIKHEDLSIRTSLRDGLDFGELLSADTP